MQKVMIKKNGFDGKFIVGFFGEKVSDPYLINVLTVENSQNRELSQKYEMDIDIFQDMVLASVSEQEEVVGLLGGFGYNVKATRKLTKDVKGAE